MVGSRTEGVRLAIGVALLAGGAGCDGAGAGGGAGPAAAQVVDSGFIGTDDGVRLFYRTVGDGEQDVVIPVAAYLEDPLVRLASPARRLVFYDPRARGRSDAGDRSRITLDRQIADLEALRGALAIDSMVLVGWSGLGMEMTVYAMRNPERVTRLVQVAPIAARDEPHNARAYRTRAERTDAGALADLRVRREGGEFAGDPAAYCRALSAVTLPASLDDSTAAASVPDVCRYPNEHPDSLARIWPSLLGSFAGYDWREEVAALRVPRLVIHGATDAFPLEGSREWVPPGSNARLLVIAGAGHFPFLERPDVFFPAVDAFLRGEWPSGSEQDGLRVDAEEAAIREVIERAYVRGLHVNRDEAAVRGGFHPEFIMTVLDGDGVIVVPLEMWLEHLGLDGQPNDEPVEGQFVFIDITGETAVAKLEVREGGEHVYTDYFGLYRFPTGWKIVNKLFQSGPGGS